MQVSSGRRCSADELAVRRLTGAAGATALLLPAQMASVERQVLMQEAASSVWLPEVNEASGLQLPLCW